MAFVMRYQIAMSYLSKPSKRRPGVAMSPGVKFVVAHDTGNPNSTAQGNVAYYERSRNDESASAHLFVDDKQIIECIPALENPQPEKAWHVLRNAPTDNQLFGYDANDAAIGVEYCYGDNIGADEAYRKYVWVIAYACARYGLDPARSVVGHFFLDPHRKTDPVTGLAHSRRTYDQLLKDVVTEYAACTSGDGAAKPVIYPVAQQGAAVATARLNIRKGAPSTRAEVLKVVAAGTKLTFEGYVDNGEPVNGNPVWYTDGKGNFFWSGGVQL
jgi:N-acetylmuramoyl-L-alanine amidase CwlA